MELPLCNLKSCIFVVLIVDEQWQHGFLSAEEDFVRRLYGFAGYICL